MNRRKPLPRGARNLPKRMKRDTRLNCSSELINALSIQDSYHAMRENKTEGCDSDWRWGGVSQDRPSSRRGHHPSRSQCQGVWEKADRARAPAGKAVTGGRRVCPAYWPRTWFQVQWGEQEARPGDTTLWESEGGGRGGTREGQVPTLKKRANWAAQCPREGE